ncbi:tyrosine-type recombinase/integrase [Dyella subtropica]|uniref:tyrosine-type recombinase/integrase n=1 Tax=Dyella subtropica TaxID=2992127 RepID=UPI003CE52229
MRGRPGEVRHIKGGPFAELNGQRALHAWRLVHKEVGIHDPDCVVHCLRHTCAARLLEATGDLKLVQEWLSHGSIVVTAPTYAHVMTHRLVGAAEALSRLRGAHFPVVEDSVTETNSNGKHESSPETTID